MRLPVAHRLSRRALPFRPAIFLSPFNLGAKQPLGGTMPNSVLEKKLNELIARDEQVSPEEVTSEFIHLRREAKAKVVTVDLTPSQYGGHDGTGLETISPDRVIAEELEADEFLSQFAVPDKP
jgi:hypothetical protein